MVHSKRSYSIHSRMAVAVLNLLKGDSEMAGEVQRT